MKDSLARNKEDIVFAVAVTVALVISFIALSALNSRRYLGSSAASSGSSVSRGFGGSTDSSGSSVSRGFGGSTASSGPHVDETGTSGLTTDNVYHIYDVDGLKEWAAYMEEKNDYSIRAILHACIEWDSDRDGRWMPVGKSEDVAYTGIFDGGGHAVSSLIILENDDTATAYAGFFGCISGTAKNLGVEDARISGSAEYAGGIAGYSYYGKIDGCWSTGAVAATSASSYALAGGIAGLNYGGTIANCWSEGSVAATGSSTAYAYAGGIAGQSTANNAAITSCWSAGAVAATASTSSNTCAGGIAGVNTDMIANCYFTGSVDGYYAGGIAGYAYYDATITACYNTGDVAAANRAGGVVGYAYSAVTITACYNTGSVASRSHAGGVAGYAYNSVAITACYNTGSVATSNYGGGGVVGYNRNDSNGGSNTITACYSTGNVEGYYAGGIAGYNGQDSSDNDVQLTACYWSGTVRASSEKDGSGTEVDGSGATWTMAQEAMNTAIKNNSSISWKYNDATASMAPTLIQS